MGETEDKHDGGASTRFAPGDLIAEAEESLATRESIPVRISYEIIQLFSEGLYQSPQKAVEELVSNSYDANADRVHVLLPDVSYVPVDSEASSTAPAEDAKTMQDDEAESTSDESEGSTDDQYLAPLWVVDNGTGIDAAGFAQLWRVADSHKKDVKDGDRAPIGQFGIGKLAAYVLAWRLTHISQVDSQILLTTMNFRRLQEVHQYDNIEPVDVDLKEISRERAMELMADIEDRDPAAWELMFGDDSGNGGSETWTAARLSDFKNLYEKLSSGRLEWVLRTGLPLHADFQVHLNGVELQSSKIDRERILTVEVGGENDTVASDLGLELAPGGGVVIPGIAGSITGTAELFEKRLTEGKSDQYSRSHGFFVRVRGRVVNLEDELFGLDALNHATWSRFSMEIVADGLREHLLSSREGVRESDPIDVLKKYLHGIFNVCRSAYDRRIDLEQAGIDVTQLLSNAPSAFVTEPVVESVRAVVESGRESYYFAKPTVPDDVDPNVWLSTFTETINEGLFSDVQYEPTGAFDRAVRYFPDSRRLVINTDHPYVEKLLASGRNRASATLFGSSELMIDAVLQDYGIPRGVVISVLSDRDKVLRLVAGDEPSTAAEVMRMLKSALTHDTALERAVGMAFRVLGFEYERRGGNKGGADGVLLARLGRESGTAGMADFKVVYDTKQTNKPSVPADKISIGSLEAFRAAEGATFGFFAAADFEGQDAPGSKLNQMIDQAREDNKPVAFIRIDHLRRIVELHYRYGVTLTRLRSLFEGTKSTTQVQQWIDELEDELKSLERRVPLLTLLQTLESLKDDDKQVPSVAVARYRNQPALWEFAPEKLTASLNAVETIIGSHWLEVDKVTGEIRLHTTAGQIVAEVERNLRDMFGIDALERSEVSGT